MSIHDTIISGFYVGQHVYCMAESEHSQGIVVGRSSSQSSRYFVLHFDSFIRADEINVMTFDDNELAPTDIRDARLQNLYEDNRFLKLLYDNNRDLVLEFLSAANEAELDRTPSAVFTNQKGQMHHVWEPRRLLSEIASGDTPGLSYERLPDGSRGILFRAELEASMQELATDATTLTL
ncbi:MAG: hypothetical protein AB8B83_00235 [Bdellovibrionales bacterium]